MLNRRDVEIAVQKFAGNLGHDGLDRLWILTDRGEIRWTELESLGEIRGAAWTKSEITKGVENEPQEVEEKADSEPQDEVEEGESDVFDFKFDESEKSS